MRILAGFLGLAALLVLSAPLAAQRRAATAGDGL